ncbi:MAG: hypothetical protein V4550_13910 [Gemmatimonadota bacterium]
MTGGSQRTALDAVHSARPIVARLSTSRDKEDLAADIIEAWSAVETGLRSLIGGSALTGQALIRELRQRHFLNLEQANALAEFHAARDRAGRVDYAPTEGDINATRDAFLKLEAGLMGDAAPVVSRPPLSAVTPAVTAVDAEPRGDHLVALPSSRPGWVMPLIGLVVLLAVGGVAWYALAGRSASNPALDQGIIAFKEGRREAAEAAFHKASLDVPNDPMPHVYLARLERERGNLGNANAEAVKGVQLGPENGAALRELASVLFATQSFDAARTFYIRAIKADSTDRMSQGFLGCSLVRLGRLDEGARWIQRAGSGAWSACSPAPGTPPSANPIVPMTAPRP